MDWVRGDSLGCGSSSTVNLAIPRKGSSLMAVKSCSVQDSVLLQNEKEILTQLGNNCPQIIKLFGDDNTIEKGERFYNLLLEYAKGGSLFSQLKKSGGCFPESNVRRYTKSMIKGLRHIHRKGFAHLDLKLENVLVFDNGKVKIADFGLAKKTGEEKQRGPEIRGTPLYMAPESVNENKYEPPCDIWALGCAVSEMASGKPAWNLTHLPKLLIKIGASDELPAVPETLSDEGKDFLSKCFVKDPSKRWTAEMLLNHPFVDVKDCDDDDEEEELSTASPRCPFEFPDWVSSAESLPDSGFWSDCEVRSEFGSVFSSCSDSLASRIRRLACDRRCDWSDSEDWVIVR